jgi:hypothetical protein
LKDSVDSVADEDSGIDGLASDGLAVFGSGMLGFDMSEVKAPAV